MAEVTRSLPGRRGPPLFDRWLKRRTRLDLPITLGYRQIFILPTRFGWLLGALMGAMLIGSLNFNNNLGLLTAFIVAAIAVNSMLLAFRNLNGLRLGHGAARPVHAGQPVSWRLAITNRDARARAGLRLRAARPGAWSDLPARSLRELIVPLPARHRGWHRPGRIRIETTQPLGLFRAWSWIEPGAPFLVWPAPALHAPPLPPGGQGRDARLHAAREEGDEFHSLRRWREGDPLHRIAWKASQRHQTLLSRRFQRELSPEVSIRLAETPGRDLEERIGIATAWILRAEAQGRPWSLEVGGERLGPDRGQAHRNAGLKALALL